MNYHANGYLVSDTSKKNYWVGEYMKGELYHGVHEFSHFPLRENPKDPSASKLCKEQLWRKVNENESQLLEFISNRSLLKRYLAACDNRKIPCKVLFVESDYDEEITTYFPRKREFLGYEVCEIPFDPWTLLDLFNHELLADFKAKLNAHGLFSREKDALTFREVYDRELHAGNVGDGEVDLYICKVFAVDIADLR